MNRNRGPPCSGVAGTKDQGRRGKVDGRRTGKPCWEGAEAAQPAWADSPIQEAVRGGEVSRPDSLRSKVDGGSPR